MENSQRRQPITDNLQLQEVPNDQADLDKQPHLVSQEETSLLWSEKGQTVEKVKHHNNVWPCWNLE